MKFFVAILIIFSLGVLFLVSNNNLNLVESGDREFLINLGIDWLDNIFSNFGEVSGNAVGLNWGPS